MEIEILCLSLSCVEFLAFATLDGVMDWQRTKVTVFLFVWETATEIERHLME
jgi:hypothetical protein